MKTIYFFYKFTTLYITMRANVEKPGKVNNTNAYKK